MSKKMKKSLKPFCPAIIEQQMKIAYEALINDHRRVVRNYEQQIRSNKDLIEDQDRLIRSYRESVQIKDRLIAKHYEVFEKLQQRFPETRDILDKMDV